MIATYAVGTSKNENEQKAGRRELMNVLTLSSDSTINAPRGRYESASILLDAFGNPRGGITHASRGRTPQNFFPTILEVRILMV